MSSFRQQKRTRKERLFHFIAFPIFLPSSSPGLDLSSPGRVLMWAAVSPVTDARDKASGPALGQGHQRMVDSFALFTKYHSPGLFLQSISASTCRSSHPNCDFIFSTAPMMVLFLRSNIFKESDVVHSAVALSYAIMVSIVLVCISKDYVSLLCLQNVESRKTLQQCKRWLLMDTNYSKRGQIGCHAFKLYDLLKTWLTASSTHLFLHGFID